MISASESNAFVRKIHKHAYLTKFSWGFFSDWIGAICGLLTGDMEKMQKHADKYSAEAGAFMAELMFDYVNLAEKYPFTDVLGVLYQAAEEAMKHAGQFFTPSALCEMMARMQFNEEEFRSIVEANGKVKVNDCCCGSGAMFLGHGKVVYEKLGTWGLNHVRYYGCDIDQTCVDMARIQLRINGLDQFGTIMRLSGSLAAIERTEPQQKENFRFNFESGQQGQLVLF